MDVGQAPLFLLLSFSGGQAEIVFQGTLAYAAFKEQFLDPYDLRGERHRPADNAAVRGALVASDGLTVATVPVWEWEVADGTRRWLCQASDDGRPPAFSAFATTEADLLNQVRRALDQER